MARQSCCPAGYHGEGQDLRIVFAEREKQKHEIPYRERERGAIVIQ
jgi:hypothetical protein